MERTSLERKLLCSQAGRIADAEVAGKFLERAASLPLLEYFKRNWGMYGFVLRNLGMQEEWEEVQNEKAGNPLTYGALCRRIAEKKRNGEKIDGTLLHAAAGRYVKGRSASDRREDKKEAEMKKEEGFRRESLESRLKRGKEAAKEARMRGEREMQQKRCGLADYYTRLEEGTEGSVSESAVIAGRIHMREYFRGLSLIIGKEDVKIPENLPPCDNLTVVEVLEECEENETYYEWLYTLLIEPFAMIEEKKELARHGRA